MIDQMKSPRILCAKVLDNKIPNQRLGSVLKQVLTRKTEFGKTDLVEEVVPHRIPQKVLMKNGEIHNFDQFWGTYCKPMFKSAATST